MFDASPFQPATWEEIEAALADRNPQTRNAEAFLAGICAKHLTDKLALAGFVFMRRTD